MSWQSLEKEAAGKWSLAILGHEYDLSLLQSLYNVGLPAVGATGRCLDLNLPSAEFEPCIQRLREVGITWIAVGPPHKVFAARMGHRFFTAKDSLGVANALMLGHETYARNTEVPAIAHMVESFEPATALVIGAGPGARSVVMALFQQGWNVRLWNRNAMKSRLLQSLFKRYGEIALPSACDPTGCSLVVNATKVGLKPGEEVPLVWRNVRSKTVIFDLVHRRVPTELIRAARLRGLPTIDGKELLVEQAALALEWWSGKTVPRDQMRESVGLVKT